MRKSSGVFFRSLTAFLCATQVCIPSGAGANGPPVLAEEIMEWFHQPLQLVNHWPGGATVLWQLTRNQGPVLRYKDGPVVGNHSLEKREMALGPNLPRDRVQWDKNIDLHIVIDSNSTGPRLEMQGESNILSQITPGTSEGECLQLRLSRSAEAHEPLEAWLTLPSLSLLRHQSPAKIDISGINGESFWLEVSGGGQVQASGEVGTLVARILEGQAGLEELEVTNQLFLQSSLPLTDLATNAEIPVRVNVGPSCVVYALVPDNAAACYSGKPRAIMPEPDALLPCSDSDAFSVSEGSGSAP